jgi:hypothetical protein
MTAALLPSNSGPVGVSVNSTDFAISRGRSFNYIMIAAPKYSSV